MATTEDDAAMAGGAAYGVPQMMDMQTMMYALQQQMAVVAQLVQMQQVQQQARAVEEGQHDRSGTAQYQTRLDIKCFHRLEKFSNKKDDWKEWRLHFLTAVGECNHDFADFLKLIEQKRRADGRCGISL